MFMRYLLDRTFDSHSTVTEMALKILKWKYLLPVKIIDRCYNNFYLLRPHGRLPQLTPILDVHTWAYRDGSYNYVWIR